MNRTVVDLCCGAGGFSLGAHQAGFSTLVAIDIDKDLTSNWKWNFPRSKIIHKDIQKLDEDFWGKELLGKKPDGVIGGPPCQGFSRIGKRDTSDPRNTLVVAFAKQVNIIDPSFFVMENVEGLLDGQNKSILNSVLKCFSKKFSLVGPMIINALDHGVPTNRKRAILVGYKPEILGALTADDFAPIIAKKNTIFDAISDIPSPLKRLDDKFEGYVWASYPESVLASQYATKLRKMPKSHLSNKVIKNRLKAGLISGLNYTNHTEKVVNRFSKVLPGDIDRISRFPRLSWDKQAPTLRAGTGKDKGSFQSMRPIHPEEPRVITIREAARIQGFPDWFVFHPTIWHSFRMIGNSVSPIFAHSILSTILKRLDGL